MSFWKDHQQRGWSTTPHPVKVQPWPGRLAAVHPNTDGVQVEQQPRCNLNNPEGVNDWMTLSRTRWMKHFQEPQTSPAATDILQLFWSCKVTAVFSIMSEDDESAETWWILKLNDYYLINIFYHLCISSLQCNILWFLLLIFSQYSDHTGIIVYYRERNLLWLVEGVQLF